MRKLGLRFVFGVIALSFLLVACATIEDDKTIEDIRKMEPHGVHYKQVMDSQLHSDDYTKWLQKDYKALALFENDEMYDYSSSEHFGRKSILSGKGQRVAPDPVSSREIDIRYQEEAQSAYNTVMDAYRQRKEVYYPAEMARLQVSYDCWLEQIEEDIQPDHIMKCKDLFYEALGKMQGIATSLVVYFENDSSEIIADEMQKLHAIVSNYKVRRMDVLVEGHTDSVGSAEYNIGLSVARAHVVKNALISLDPHMTDIAVQGFGETSLAIPTGDGRSEPRNRRAIIHFR